MPGRSKAYEVLPSPSDVRRASSMLAVRPVGGKGKGVVAVARIPKHTFVAPYPGTRYALATHSRRIVAGDSDGTYAVEFWKPNASGRPVTRYVMDPGGPPRTGVLPRYASAIAPLVNEPTDDPPNLMWVWNVPLYRIELWTTRDVRPGEELTICYGNDGEYARGYQTCCCSRPKEVEPELHVKTAPRGKPMPWRRVGSEGVATATKAMHAGG